MDGAFDEQIRPPLAGNGRCLPNLVHIGPLARGAGGIGEHGHPGFDIEHGGGVRRADGDLGQLLGIGVRVDGAVTKDQDPGVEAHEKDAGDQAGPGPGLDNLESRPDGVLGGVGGAGDHPRRQVVIHHEGPEIIAVQHQVLGHLPGDPLVLAQFIISLGELGAPGRGGGVDDGGAAELQAEGGGVVEYGLVVAKDGEPDAAAAQDDIRGPQDALVITLRQHNTALGLPGALEEIVLEHHRAHADGAVTDDALLELADIHMGFEPAQGGGEFPVVLRGDGAGDGVDVHGGGEGIGVHADDGEGEFLEPGNQLHDVGRRQQPAGEDEPGHMG